MGTTSAAATPAPASIAQAAAPSPAPPPVPVLARAGECLRTEAPRAAKAEASVKLAVDLLLEDLCGAVVERAALYTHNAEALARFTPQSERAAAGLNAARVEFRNGRDRQSLCRRRRRRPRRRRLGVAADLTAPAPLRRYAAELVLAARTPVEPREPRKKPIKRGLRAIGTHFGR